MRKHKNLLVLSVFIVLVVFIFVLVANRSEYQDYSRKLKLMI